jgi:beta-phosphoglucomutase-like phosphatase (HAD superfamily)
MHYLTLGILASLLSAFSLHAASFTVPTTKRPTPEPAANVLERMHPTVTQALVVSSSKSGIVADAITPTGKLRVFIFTKKIPKEGAAWQGSAKPMGVQYFYTTAAGKKVGIPAYDSGEAK